MRLKPLGSSSEGELPAIRSGKTGVTMGVNGVVEESSGAIGPDRLPNTVLPQHEGDGFRAKANVPDDMPVVVHPPGDITRHRRHGSIAT